jgi:hypothetical protein
MAQIGVNRGCESLSGYISGIVVVRPGGMAAREAGLVGGGEQGEFLSLLTLTAGGPNDPVRLEELQKFLPKEGE